MASGVRWWMSCGWSPSVTVTTRREGFEAPRVTARVSQVSKPKPFMSTTSAAANFRRSEGRNWKSWGPTLAGSKLSTVAASPATLAAQEWITGSVVKIRISAACDFSIQSRPSSNANK